MDIGFPQGGPMSPVLFREYATDIPACINTGTMSWLLGEVEDKTSINNENDITENDKTKESFVTLSIGNKNEEDKSEEEKWEEELLRKANNIESWKREKNRCWSRARTSDN